MVFSQGWVQVVAPSWGFENVPEAGFGRKLWTCMGSGDNYLPHVVQPADTHHFYKDVSMHLKECFTESMARSPTGVLDLCDVFMAINNADRHVCQPED